MMNEIELFLKRLKEYSPPHNVNNFYSNDVCLKNLKLYFNYNKNAEIILIGEAPGYKGCRNTGIPFTSEHILISNPFNIIIFGSEKGYKKTSKEKLEKEITATIIWKNLKELNQIPLTWNIYPFHPHNSDNKNSNRKPNKKEVKEGELFLTELLDTFSSINTIIAVGNLAHNCLNKLNINHRQVRHPSYGGKEDFEKGIKNILK